MCLCVVCMCVCARVYVCMIIISPHLLNYEPPTKVARLVCVSVRVYMLMHVRVCACMDLLTHLLKAVAYCRPIEPNMEQNQNRIPHDFPAE